jgi:hypothetical protein
MSATGLKSKAYHDIVATYTNDDTIEPDHAGEHASAPRGQTPIGAAVWRAGGCNI